MWEKLLDWLNSRSTVIYNGEDDGHCTPTLTVKCGENEYSENYQYSRAINLAVYAEELAQLTKIIQFDTENIIICTKCKCPFSKKPDRKTKCKSCGEYIYVRTYPYPANKLEKSKIYVNTDGLKLLDVINEFSYETIAHGDITLKTIYAWFNEWHKRTNVSSPWSWYQHLRRKYIQNVKCLSDIYAIDAQMVKVCINRQKYEIAMSYVAECLTFNKQEDDELMPGIVFLYQDIEKCVGKNEAFRLLNSQCAKFSKLNGSKIFRELIKEIES